MVVEFQAYKRSQVTSSRPLKVEFFAYSLRVTQIFGEGDARHGQGVLGKSIQELVDQWGELKLNGLRDSDRLITIPGPRAISSNFVDDSLSFEEICQLYAGLIKI